MDWSNRVTLHHLEGSILSVNDYSKSEYLQRVGLNGRIQLL